MDMIIRSELKSDYFENENVTREAFWNLFVPGCNEHVLVHKLREHPDYLPGLSFVAMDHDKIIGNIFYAKSHLVNEENMKLNTLTFGPVSVLPQYQRKGVGSALIRHTVEIARSKNYAGIIIYGHPYNYCKHGFKSARDYNIANAEGKFPYSLLVLELRQDVFKGHSWKFCESDVYNIGEAEAEEYDQKFPPKVKEHKFTQEEFFIACRAFLE
jgi:predicted N-acetyltransferase YhbS